MKPLLFLDLDDVLNIRVAPYDEYLVEVATDDLPTGPFINEFAGPCVELSICVPRAYPAWLSELSEVFELVWATTWEHAANRYISPLLGLPELPVVKHSALLPRFSEVKSGQPALWKIRSILDFAGSRPFAFVDDRAYGLDSWLEAVAPELTTLVLVPERGLTRAHVDELVSFAHTCTP